MTGRPQSRGEEIANAVSHGAGTLLAVVALPVLLVNAVIDRRSGVELFALTLFGVSVMLMYLTSTLYHAMPSGAGADRAAGVPHVPRTAKRVFRVLDHSAIYLLIAGTYTPFALGVLRDDWGWPVFALVWGLAIAGVILKSVAGVRFPVLSVVLYLAMGWLVVAVADPLFTKVPAAGLAWLVAGGVTYTVGVVFFVLDNRIRYAHFAWHLFVLGGTACHVVAVMGWA